MAIRSGRPSLLAEFYQHVFELRPLEGTSDNGQSRLSDGRVSVVIIPTENNSYRAMTEGPDHIGFKVEDLKKAGQELEDLGKSHSDSAPKKIDLGRFGHITRREIESCVLGQVALSDPDGVLMDLVE